MEVGEHVLELVYLSYANQGLDEPQLVDLLKKSRANNAKVGITGILLYDGKSMFIQALEGDDKDVDALFKKIEADTRHDNIVTLWRNNITDRAFPDWQMGFKEFGPNTLADLDGFSNYLSTSISSSTSDNKHFTLVLLEHFKNKLRYP